MTQVPHAILAGIYEELKFWDQSIEAWRQAIRLESTNPNFYFCVAYVHTKLEYEETVDALREGTRLEPKDTEAHYFLGLTYLDLGDRGSALEEYKVLKLLDKAKANDLFRVIYP